MVWLGPRTTVQVRSETQRPQPEFPRDLEQKSEPEGSNPTDHARLTEQPEDTKGNPWLPAPRSAAAHPSAPSTARRVNVVGRKQTTNLISLPPQPWSRGGSVHLVLMLPTLYRRGRRSSNAT